VTVRIVCSVLDSGKLGQHLSSGLSRVFAGYVVAAVIGIGLGVAIGRSKWADDVLLPPLEVLRPIPAVAWITLAILMFPSSELSMIFITFIGALFPILLNTVHGVEGVDPRLIVSAKSLGAGCLSILSEVILPGSAPSIIVQALECQIEPGEFGRLEVDGVPVQGPSPQRGMVFQQPRHSCPASTP